VHGFSGVERLHGKDLSAQQSKDKPEYDGLASRQCADGHFKKKMMKKRLSMRATREAAAALEESTRAESTDLVSCFEDG